jgi:hypothetical protein
MLKKRLSVFLLCALLLGLTAVTAYAEDVTMTFQLHNSTSEAYDAGCRMTVKTSSGASASLDAFDNSWHYYSLPYTQGDTATYAMTAAPGWRPGCMDVFDGTSVVSGDFTYTFSLDNVGSPYATGNFLRGDGTVKAPVSAIGEMGTVSSLSDVSMTVGAGYHAEDWRTPIRIVNNTKFDLAFLREGIVLTGANADAFKLNYVSDYTEVRYSASWGFEVQPKEGLAPGVYEADITLNERDGLVESGALSAHIRFEVLPLDLTDSTRGRLVMLGEELHLPYGQVGREYDFTLTGMGAVSTDEWVITDGALPKGLTLTSSGEQCTISGTPAPDSAGWAHLTLTQKHSGEDAVSVSYPMAIYVYVKESPYLFISSGTYFAEGGTLLDDSVIALPDVTVGNGQIYTETDVYLDSRGTGLDDRTSIRIEGAPDWLETANRFQYSRLYHTVYSEIVPGDYTLTARALYLEADGETVVDESDPQYLSLHVNAPPKLVREDLLQKDGQTYLPAATTGKPYSCTIRVNSGPLPFTAAIQDGYRLPEGLSLTYDADSVTISGTPAENQAWRHDLYITLTNDAGAFNENICININDPLALTILYNSSPVDALPAGVAGNWYPGLITGHGIYTDCTAEWVVEGGLPPFMYSNDIDSVAAGTPEAAGSWSWTIRWTLFDVDGTKLDEVKQSFSLTVYEPLDSVYRDRWYDLPAMRVGEAIEPVKLGELVSGGSGSLTWALVPGFMLPDGLTLDEAAGILSGTPAAAGYGDSFHVAVTDVLSGDQLKLLIEYPGGILATIVFDANGGTGEMPPAIYLDPYILPDPGNFMPPEGYRFSHWEIDGENYNAGDVFSSMVNVTAKAIWEKIPVFTLSFDANGGRGEMAPVEVREGELVQLPSCEFIPAAHFTFAGWDVNGVTLSPGDPIELSDDMMIRALWTRVSETSVSGRRSGGDVEYTVAADEESMGRTVTVIAAVYDERGRMTSVQLKEITLSAEEQTDTLTGLPAGGASLFLVGGDYAPLCASGDVE